MQGGHQDNNRGNESIYHMDTDTAVGVDVRRKREIECKGVSDITTEGGSIS